MNAIALFIYLLTFIYLCNVLITDLQEKILGTVTNLTHENSWKFIFAVSFHIQVEQ